MKSVTGGYLRAGLPHIQFLTLPTLPQHTLIHLDLLMMAVQLYKQRLFIEMFQLGIILFLLSTQPKLQLQIV